MRVTKTTRGLFLVLAVLSLATFTTATAETELEVTPEQEARLADIRAAIDESGATWVAEHTTMSVLPHEEAIRRLGGGYPPRYAAQGPGVVRELLGLRGGRRHRG